MWPWQRRRREKPSASLADLDVKDRELQLEERKLKLEAIRRVAQEESDSVTALEVITVATHRGNKPPNVTRRQKPEQSPLEAIAMAMLESRLKEDPGEALDKALERKLRLDEAAETLSGGNHRRRGGGDGTGSPIVDMFSAIANSELGNALGSVLGAGMVQRMQTAAATQAAADGQVDAPSRPPPVVVTPIEQPTVVPEQPQAVTPQLDATAPPVPPVRATLPTGATPPPMVPAARPVSFRVGIALRTLRGLEADAAARWLLGQGEASPEVDELLAAFTAADPDAVPVLLEATAAEAANSPTTAEWLPVLQHFRENLDWTLRVHAAMRELLEAEADEADRDEAASSS